jgi:hypothetical protein
MKASCTRLGARSARRVRTMVAVCALLGGSEAANAEAPARDSTIAVGLKAGYIPPVLLALSAGVHVPHLYVGVFGVPPYAVVAGNQFVVGAEIAAEAGAPNTDGGYVSISIFHYQSVEGRAPNPENGEVLTATIGYEWKWNWVELAAGGGALFVLGQRLPPGSAFAFPGTVLPAIDLAARVRF